MNQIIFYGVTKKYGDTDILLEQDFSLKDGLTFLVGKNGAGKTTLIRLSTGLEAVTAGRIDLFGRPVTQIDKDIKRRLGLQLQNDSFLRNVRVGEYIRLYEALYEGEGGAKKQESLESNADKGVNTVKIREILEIDHLFKRYAYTLSGGEKKKVSLYLTLIGNRELIILDEPTAGIDVEVKDRIVSVIIYLRECGVNLLISSHDLEEFYGIADNILMLDRGFVFDGTKEIFQRKYNYPYKVCTERNIQDSGVLEGDLFEKKYLYGRDIETLLKYFDRNKIEQTTAKDLYQIALLDGRKRGQML